MKKIPNIIKLLSIMTLFVLTSCDPENPSNPNEQEYITSVALHFSDSTNTFAYAYSDSDGDGGNPAIIDTIVLSASQTYHVSLDILDETKNPVDTITLEIEEEGVDHQFFFNFSGVNTTVQYDDLDANNMPIGLHTIWNAGTVSTGTFTLTLKHQPGIKDGQITTGETDIEITFHVVVQ